jgi:two-component system response regulator HydG
VAAYTETRTALHRLSNGEYDCVLTDLALEGDQTGLDVCRQVLDLHPELPVVVLTAFGSLESAIGAIRAGAYDFVTKPVDMESLGLVVDRAVKFSGLKREVRRLRTTNSSAPPSAIGMIGESVAMQNVADLIDRVAQSEASVLITGESGTGKELVANAIHERSGRRGRFVPINCAAVPETLLESELFGHLKGAFTDAKAPKKGLFVDADGGTVFLDEIGELPLSMQPKLLRALQEHCVRPVGSTTEVPFDARVITATNRDLDSEVAEGRFREDLFYRVNVVRIELPPLRARGNDVLLLAQHFLEKMAKRSGKSVVGLVPDAAEKLLSYPFPGNVRELENAMERAVALARYDKISVDDLPERIREHSSTRLVVPTDDPAHLLTMDEIEQRYICKVLELTGGNKTQAAKTLGFDRRTLYRKMERYGIS